MTLSEWGRIRLLGSPDDEVNGKGKPPNSRLQGGKWVTTFGGGLSVDMSASREKSTTRVPMVRRQSFTNR